MSDFDGVEWLENITKPPVTESKEIAPVGVNSARIITAEKYKSAAGNWTVRVVYEMNEGKNRDHIEFYSLWSPNENVKRISNEMFTQLSKATGFKSFPASASELVNKTLDLGIYHKEETWTNNEGEEVVSNKTKIGEYLSAVSPVAPVTDKAKSPPKL
tara:strand:- start:2048 stop:2521 length:474 start_codon:yes stop_codon:yes gene_type:complete